LKRYGNFSSAAHRHLAAASVSPDFVSLEMSNKVSCYSPTVCSVYVLYVEDMRELGREGEANGKAERKWEDKRDRIL